MFFRKDKENQEKEEVKTSEEQYSGELKVLETRIIDSSLPEEVKKVLLKELEKIKYISTSSAEYTIGLNYINYVLELPWDIITQDNLDLKHAKEILDEDHYGLDDVKERILEFLAIRQLRSRKKVKILVVETKK